MELKKLIEEREAILSKQQAIVAKEAPTPDERAEFDKLDISRLDIEGDIKRCQSLEAAKAAASARRTEPTAPGTNPPPDANDPTRAGVFKGPTNEQRNNAFIGWCRKQYDIEPTDEQRADAKACGVNLEARELEIKLRNTSELRGTSSQSVGTSTLGGYLVPYGFVNSLEQAMAYYGPMRQVSDVIRTEGGGPLQWPTANDSGVAGVLVAEAATYATSDVTFGQLQLDAFKYSSGLIKVSSELLQDSAFDLPSILGGMMGERIGRITNTHFTTGDASSKPNGIVTASTAGKTAASATAFTFDELMDLVNSVDPVYRSSCAFMMHTNLWNYIRKLKDGSSRYMLQDQNLAAGIPALLLGYPVYINNDMQSSVATGTKTVLFGVMNKYKIRDVGSIRVKRLVELYAGTDQEGFVAFSRHDGDLLNAGGNPVKHLVQA